MQFRRVAGAVLAEAPWSDMPPDEIRQAVLRIAQTHLGAENDEIIAVASRLFGFRSTGAKIRQVIAAVVDELLTEGCLHKREERLYAS